MRIFSHTLQHHPGPKKKKKAADFLVVIQTYGSKKEKKRSSVHIYPHIKEGGWGRTWGSS